MRLLAAALFMILLATPQAQAGPFEDGMEAYRNKDYASARIHWLPLAEGGHTQAMNNVGLMYKNGIGVHKDQKKAYKLFKQSAEQGFSLAQYNLAGMYQKGTGVKKNRKEAVRWMRIAANTFSRAQYKLAFWNLKGFGMKKDPVNAMKWYLIVQNKVKGRLLDKVSKDIDKLKGSLSPQEMAKAEAAAEAYVPDS